MGLFLLPFSVVDYDPCIPSVRVYAEGNNQDVELG